MFEYTEHFQMCFILVGLWTVCNFFMLKFKKGTLVLMNRGTALFTIMYLLPCNYCEVRCSPHIQHHLIHMYQPFFHERNFPLMLRVFQRNMFKFNPDGWLTYTQVGGSFENQFRKEQNCFRHQSYRPLTKRFPICCKAKLCNQDPFPFFVCFLTVPKSSSEM